MKLHILRDGSGLRKLIIVALVLMLVAIASLSLHTTAQPACAICSSTAIGARVYNSADISINHDTITLLTFNSERFDTDNMHSISTDTSRITINTAGVYVVSGHVRWDANSSGSRMVGILLNGTTVIGRASSPANASGTTAQSVAAVYEFAANDYIELQVYQSSGGALNVTTYGNLSPEFSAARIP